MFNWIVSDTTKQYLGPFKFDLCKTEFFLIECFDLLTVCNKWIIFNSIVSDTGQYLEPFNSFDLC